MTKETKPEIVESVETPVEELSTGDQIRADLADMEKESPDMTLASKDTFEPKADSKDKEADPKSTAKEPDPVPADDKTVANIEAELIQTDTKALKADEKADIAKVTDPELTNPLLAHTVPAKSDTQPDQNTLLLQQIQGLQAQLATIQAAQKVEPKVDLKPTQAKEPSFQFEVQEQLVNAIQSDDPNIARQGINYMAQAIAKSTYDQVMKGVNARIQGIETNVAELPQQLSTTEENKRIQTDYYGAFPAHANFRDIVREEAGKLSSLYPQNSFDENFRNALGTLVNRRLTGLGLTTPPANVNPKPIAPEHTSNTRRVASSSANSANTVTNEILNLM